MPNDLEASLVDGGIPAAAAKILSNAIGNAATGRTAYGRQYVDGTPVNKMRMIDADTRRYVLTNLDHSSDSAFSRRLTSTAGQYKPRDVEHPYKDSQPATASPTLATGSLANGSYIATKRKSSEGVSQTEVTLDVVEKGGTHARLNKSTGKVESVPIFVEATPRDMIEATVREESGRTVISIRLK